MLLETGLSLPQNLVLNEFLSQTNKWLFLYIGWDSAWYISIITKGYQFSNQSYAFFPGVVIFVRFFQNVFRNSLLSTFIITFVFGCIWVPVYQAVAERYMNKRKAFMSTLLFAFFPYVFLFTSVVYTEGLFLFFSLLTWRYFERREMNKALVYASISTLIRPVGFLIAIPIFLYNLQVSKETKNLLPIIKGLAPFITLFGWFLYCKLATGNWLASMNTSEWNEMYTLYTWATKILPEFEQEAFAFPIKWLNLHPFTPFFIIFFIVLMPLTLPDLLRQDKFSGIYSITYSASILIIGTVLSYPRFLSFLFPIWVYWSKKLLQNNGSVKLSIILILIFFLISLELWQGFISGVFIA
jgi:Gpi18-like mannosyltransferase